MIIKTNLENRECTFSLIGRLDTSTVSELESIIKECIDSIDSMIFDFAGLEYISSAGLRVLLASHKKMMTVKGSMTIINVSDSIKKIFIVTGMDNVFNFE